MLQEFLLLIFPDYIIGTLFSVLLSSIPDICLADSVSIKSVRIKYAVEYIGFPMIKLDLTNSVTSFSGG